MGEFLSVKKIMPFLIAVIFVSMLIIGVDLYISKTKIHLPPEEAEELLCKAYRETVFGNIDKRFIYFSKDTNKALTELFSWEDISEGYSAASKEKVKHDLIENAKNMAGIVVNPNSEDWYERLMKRLFMLDLITKLQSYNKTPEKFLENIIFVDGTEKDTIKGKSIDFLGAGFEDPTSPITINFSYERNGWKPESDELIEFAERLTNGMRSNLSRAEIGE